MSQLTKVSGSMIGGQYNSAVSPNAPIYENLTTITQSYSITTGTNAMSAGPITINDGVTVSIPNGSVWTIV
jgi:hypothetical protein